MPMASAPRIVGQLEGVVGAEPGRIDTGVLGQAGEQRGGPQEVDEVAGVLAVAAERHPAAPAHQLGVAPGARHALAEAQVGPRAGGDRGAGAEEGVDLVVVEVDGVGDEHVRSEHAEVVEVDERDAGRCGPGRRRRRRPTARGGTSARSPGRGPARWRRRRARRTSGRGRRGSPSRSPGRPAGTRRARAAWRSSTSGAGAANGPSSTSQPHVPTVPRMPTAAMPAATRSGWATVPASIVVVMPLVTASTQASVADSSSSSAVCAACTGTAQREDRLAGGRGRRGSTSGSGGRR